MSRDAEVKNIERIAQSIDQHNKNCTYPVVAVEMNPFEIERLGWDNIKGLPIRPNKKLGTGRFRVVCSQEDNDSGEKIEDAVTKDRELEKVSG